MALVVKLLNDLPVACLPRRKPYGRSQDFYPGVLVLVIALSLIAKW